MSEHVLGERTHNGIQVLHVDDDPGFVDLTVECLHREDDRFAVETATSAAEGLDRLAEGGVDCVISDYDMPGRSGIDFLEAVRADYPDLPFVLFTGKGSEQVASEAVSAGVTEYLQKEGTTDQYTVLANTVANAVERYRIEREAERTRTRLAAITGSSTDAIVTVDTENTIRFANPAAEDIFGYEPDHLVGEPVTTLMAEAYREPPLEALDRSLAAGTRGTDRTSVEWDGQHADGHEIPLSVSVGEFSIDGERRFVATFRDVSEREESRRRLQTLISNLPGIVYRARNTPDWEMEQVEGECESLTGYPASALESGEVSWGEEVIHPTDAGELWGPVQEAIEAGEPFEVTYRIVTADGTTRWMWERGQAVERPDDEPTLLEGFITEITERERRKQALEYERDRLAAVFDAIPHPIMEVEFRDGDPIVQQVNDAFEDVFEYAERHVVGESIDDFIVPEEHSAEATDLNRSARERQMIEQEVERVTADGERRTFLFRSSRVHDEDGTHWLATYIDITERKAHRRDLERQNERLDQFASIVSHDLRNPLNVASARLELATDECDSPHLADVADAHRQMEDLIEDILTLARAGTEATDEGVVDLASLVEGCWETVDTDRARLTVNTDRRIRADTDRLRQLVENLLSNAVAHGSTSPGSDGRQDDADPDTAVTVTVGELPGGFYVEDDGPGIPAEDREEIFEAGYSTARAGTGFGLSIVERLADIHGWDIRAVEGSEGGARFEITGVTIE